MALLPYGRILVFGVCFEEPECVKRTVRSEDDSYHNHKFPESLFVRFSLKFKNVTGLETSVRQPLGLGPTPPPLPYRTMTPNTWANRQMNW